MKRTRAGLVAGLLCLWIGGPAWSQTSLGEGEQSYQGIRYVCTGVTKEERQNPAWRRYPLKLEFAAAGGAYLADVAVTVQDSAGSTVLQADCLAPWLLADLSPGRYRVTGTAGGTITKSMTVSVAAGRQAARVLRFPEITR